jgi:hypothetical protein
MEIGECLEENVCAENLSILDAGTEKEMERCCAQIASPKRNDIKKTFFLFLIRSLLKKHLMGIFEIQNLV